MGLLSNTRGSAIVVAACGLLLSAESVYAQAVEEILVTARKREESLLDVPVAVTVFSADTIERAGIDSLTDITLRTPGVQYTDQSTIIVGRHKTAIRFRGMDTNNPVPSQQVGTVFLDGIYVQSGVQSLDLGTLERVEVIKGPQSALFGRSTFGGAINYVTRSPADDYQGRISTSFSQDSTYDVSVAHEGPLIRDRLAYRATLRGFGTGGQYTSVTDGGDLGDESTRSVNLVLEATPSDELTARLRVFYAEDRDGPADGIFIGTALSNFDSGPALANCNALDPSRTATDYFCGNVQDIVESAGFSWEDLASSNTRVNAAVADILRADTATETLSGNTDPKIGDIPTLASIGLRRDQTRVALSVDYDFAAGTRLGGHTLSFLGGYSEMRNNYARDFDSTSTGAWIGQDPQYDEDWVVEARWTSPADGRLRYSGGISFLDAIHREAPVLDVLLYDPAGTIGAFGIPGPLVFYGNTPEDEGSEALGVFAAVGYDLTDALTVDLEARWQRDTISQGSAFEGEFTNLLPRVTLSWRPADAVTSWVTYSEGNLPGFFNPALVGLDAAEIAQIEAQVGAVGLFNDEEELENYEIGIKGNFLDSRLRLSAVAYWMDWANQKTRQGVSFTDSETGQLRVTSIQTNAGNSELYGLELESNIYVSDRLSAEATFNVARAEYKDFTCSFSTFVEGSVGGRVPCDGNRPPKFPDISGSLALQWNDSLNGNWDYYARVDATYFGKAYNEEANFSWIGEYWRAGLRAGVRRDDLRVEAFVTNLFDDDNPESAARVADFSTAAFAGFATQFGVVLAPPVQRQLGVRLIWDF
ncbi:MAG: TonB-dependent receptor plug domain-containing protein [Pseudomonadota bacterium]